jgi:hypothetical protein
LAAPAVWELWAEPRRRAGPDAPALPPAAEHAVAAGHAAAPPRVEPGGPVAQLRAVRAGAAVLLWAAPAVAAVLRQAEPGEAAVLQAGAAARLREGGPDAAPPPQVVRAAAALPWAAAWVFRRDRLRLAARRRPAPSARAMRSLRTASPQQPSWPAARDEVLS